MTTEILHAKITKKDDLLVIVVAVTACDSYKRRSASTRLGHSGRWGGRCREQCIKVRTLPPPKTVPALSLQRVRATRGGRARIQAHPARSTIPNSRTASGKGCRPLSTGSQPQAGTSAPPPIAGGPCDSRASASAIRSWFICQDPPRLSGPRGAAATRPRSRLQNRRCQIDLLAQRNTSGYSDINGRRRTAKRGGRSTMKPSWQLSRLDTAWTSTPAATRTTPPTRASTTSSRILVTGGQHLQVTQVSNW